MASTFRFVWDGNVLLHESFKKDNSENTELTTWVFEGFVPTAKLVNGKAYSIISDHLGTPILAVDSEGNQVWNRELEIYGRVRHKFVHPSFGGDGGGFPFIPFLYQGQYYDFETKLAYNRFSYYSPETGAYISQDPIGLAGGNPNIYAYVKDSYWRIDIFGLTTCEEEIRALPRLENMTRDQIFRILDEKGFYMIKNDDGDFSFAKYTYKDDKYAVVRVDKGNKDLDPSFAGYVDHAHKDTSKDIRFDENGLGFTKVRTKTYSDNGDRSSSLEESHIPIAKNTSNYEYRNTL